MRWLSRGAAGRMAATVAVAAGAFSLFGVSTAFAAGGTATITKPDATTPLNSGGSQDSWTIKLPAGASCSQDTSIHNFHVFGYIVPATVDPSTLTYGPSGPNGTGNNALLDTTGTAYANANTAPSSGAVLQPPTMSYAFFSPDGSAGVALPTGLYNVGVACANASGNTDGNNFWNVQERFTASTTDPNGEVWAVVPGSQVPESPLTVALPLSALAIIGGVVVITRRRRGVDMTTAA